MPVSNDEEAAERLRRVANALEDIEGSFVPTFSQRISDEEGEEMEAFASYGARLARWCGAGHLAVETAVKALIHLLSLPKAQAWGHNIEVLLDQLPEPHRSHIETRMVAVDVENLQKWQEQARCEQRIAATPETFTAIATAACKVALYAADQFEPGLGIAARVRRNVSVIEEALTRRDLYTGLV